MTWFYNFDRSRPFSVTLDKWVKQRDVKSHTIKSKQAIACMLPGGKNTNTKITNSIVLKKLELIESNLKALCCR